MSKPVPRLGKGLSALIGSREPIAVAGRLTSVGSEPAMSGSQALRIDQIRPNSRQPRTYFNETQLRQLADSIARTGVLQPILVRASTAGSYELIAGERRWRAAQLAGLAEIPAVIREASDAEVLEWALVENLQREDLGPLERAQAYQQYLETFHVGPDDLAARLAESRSNVVNYIRLLKLPVSIRGMIESGDLGMGQARAIAGVADEQRQLALAKLAVRRNLSVRQVEELCRAPGRSTEEVPARVDRHMDELSRELSKSLGMTVQLRGGKKKNSGSIVIRYRSLDEFERVTERLIGNSALLTEAVG